MRKQQCVSETDTAAALMELLKCGTERLIVRTHIKAPSEMSAVRERSAARTLPRSSHTSAYPLMPSPECCMCVSFSALGT